MARRLLGLGAGNPGGSAEILLQEALLAARAAGADVELVRLDELDLETTGGQIPQDAWWFWERLMEADGLIASAPIISRTIPGRLKVLIDQLLGPNADRAIVEQLLAVRASGREPGVPFRLDERVLRPRVAGFIAVGGSLTPQWKALALPAMHILTFSMHTSVVDQFVVHGAGTPRSVVLDPDALARAARLGAHVASQLGRTPEQAEYAGEPGLCPMCHLDAIVLTGREVQCATCGALGHLADGGEVTWTDLDTSVLSMAEKRAHYDEIVETAQRHAALRATVQELAAPYDSFDPVVRPGRPTPHQQEARP